MSLHVSKLAKNCSIKIW